MNRRLLLGALALAVLAGQAPAGIIFNRKKDKDHNAKDAKPPQDPVGDLIRILRGDADERRRLAAADELSRVDLKQFPQIGAALVDALQKDHSANVRAAAADALGKVRPMAMPIGQALEQSLNADPAAGVRNSARNSLSVYFRAGYRPAGVGPARPETPPPAVAVRPPVVTVPPVSQPSRPSPVGQSDEPPLATSTPRRIADVPAKPLKTTKPPIFEEVPNPAKVVDKPNPAKIVEDEPAPVKQSKPKEVKPATPTKPAKSDDDGPILDPDK